MKPPKRKKSSEEDAESEKDTRPVRFEALAELTSSEVIQQVKDGMSRIAPLELDEDDSEQPSY